MAEEKTLAAISDDTKSMLEDHVKKGKARKFILITKGSSIKALIVFKKGPFGPKIIQAKKDGFRGEVTCGLITGKGVDLTFQLPGTPEVSEAMRTEGNVTEDEPCKLAKMRAFLKDEADLKFKPDFAVIKTVNDIARVSELDEDEEGETGTPDAPPPMTDQESQARAQKLTEALERLKPLVDQAANARPNRQGELHTTIERIRGEIQSGQWDQAKQSLVDFAALLRTVGGGQGPAPEGEPPDRSAQFAARRDAIESQLAEAQSAAPEKGAKLDEVWRYANEQARSNDFDKALKALDRLSEVISKILKTDSETDQESTVDPLEMKWLAAFAKLEPMAIEALKSNPFGNESALSEFRTAWDWAVNCAADKAYDKALAALPNVVNMLKSAQASGTSAPVADVNPEVRPFAEARLNWGRTRATMAAELKKLQNAIVTACDGDDELQAVADGVSELTEYLVRLDERLEDKLDQIVNSEPGPTRDNLKREARQLLSEYETELSNEFFEVVDSENGFANVSVASTAKTALAEISRVLS